MIVAPWGGGGTWYGGGRGIDPLLEGGGRGGSSHKGPQVECPFVMPSLYRKPQNFILSLLSWFLSPLSFCHVKNEKWTPSLQVVTTTPRSLTYLFHNLTALVDATQGLWFDWSPFIYLTGRSYSQAEVRCGSTVIAVDGHCSCRGPRIVCPPTMCGP